MGKSQKARLLHGVGVNMIKGKTNYKAGDVIICIYKSCELPDIFKVGMQHHHYDISFINPTVDIGIKVLGTSIYSSYWQARTFCIKSVSGFLDMLKPDALRILVCRNGKIIYEWKSEENCRP